MDMDLNHQIPNAKPNSNPRSIRPALEIGGSPLTPQSHYCVIRWVMRAHLQKQLFSTCFKDTLEDGLTCINHRPTNDHVASVTPLNAGVKKQLITKSRFDAFCALFTPIFI
jgi:hypothetical protein